MPMAFVRPIHWPGVSVKLFSPACFLNPSNSTGLKAGLFNCSQMCNRSQRNSGRILICYAEA